jgi:hypothetical protein
MTTDLEERLRQTLRRSAESAPMGATTWAGPLYVTPPHRRSKALLIAAAAAVAVLVVGVVVVQAGDGGHGPAATAEIDGRPRALPEGPDGWDVVDLVDSTNWVPVETPAVQLFERADGATVRIVTQSTAIVADPPDVAPSPPTSAAVTTTAAGTVGGETAGEGRSWQVVGDGGVVSFTVGDEQVNVQVKGLTRDQAYAVVDGLNGVLGAFDAPGGFTAAGISSAGPPALFKSAQVALARSGTATTEVTITTSAAAAGRTDIRLDQPLTGLFGTYEGTGADTRLVVDREDASPYRSIAWLQNGARIMVSSGTASMDELRRVAAATRLVSIATWQVQQRQVLERFEALPEIVRIPLGDATVVARGSDPTWPAAVCLETGGAERCYVNQVSEANSPTSVVDSVVAGGWWILGFAQGGLSSQSALTPDHGTTTLRRVRVGETEWFASHLPDSATSAQGEISAVSGSGSGGPWFRP